MSIPHYIRMFDPPSEVKLRLTTELAFIQNCINRMASNSTLIKGLAVCVFAVSILFMIHVPFLSFAPIPLLLVMWGLDAYYLRLEREYWGLYNWVVKHRGGQNGDGALCALYALHEFNLDPTRFADEVAPWHRVALSVSVLPLYAALILGLLIAYFGILCSI